MNLKFYIESIVFVSIQLYMVVLILYNLMNENKIRLLGHLINILSAKPNQQYF